MSDSADAGTLRTPATSCPHCGALIDAISAMDDESAPPEPGAVSVCLYCARVLVVEEGYTYRIPSAVEHDEFLQHPDVRRLVGLAKRYGPRDPGARNPDRGSR